MCIAENIFCYYGSWAVYRSGEGKFDIENIDPFLCSHAAYAFIGLNDNGLIKLVDPYNDIQKGQCGRIEVFYFF